MKFKTRLEQEIYFFNKPYLGDGSEGRCYRINDAEAAKIFYPDSHFLYDEKNLLQFKDINIPGFSFAKEIIYLRKELIGIIYPFMRGVSLLERSIDKAPLNDLYIALNKLLLQIKRLSELQIKVDDIALRNTIYFLQEFSFIDTACYAFVNTSYSDLYKENCEKIMYIILSDILHGKNIIRFIDFTLNIRWQEDSNALLNPVLFLEEIRKKAQEITEMEANDFYSLDSQLLRQK